jgi:reverse transcriptase-like protein
VDIIEVFLAEKEARDRQTSIELRAKGVITTPGGPFIFSRRKEIDGLLARGVFELISGDSPEIGDARIFGSRLVDEVKGKGTATPYEKSRLVVQAFNDEGKKTVLTQSPTIQRVSQRIIVAIAPSLLERGITLHLRDITQAYVQSTSKLSRVIYARPPKDMIGELPPNVIFKVIKPLYGIPEAGTHWFGTYHKHHREKLGMGTSTYDPCLLITKDKNGPFGLVGMQTDDTLILGDNEFVKQEDVELKRAKLLAKPSEQLTGDNPLLFNAYKLMIDGDEVALVQKEQGKRLRLIDPNSDEAEVKQAYLEQRARGAYIGTICQPEAAFDLSVAAQHQSPGKEEIKALNRRLQWQMDNLDRGLHFIPLDLSTAKLFIFTDGSFANNSDLSSQIGYVVVLGNETHKDGEFSLRGNGAPPSVRGLLVQYWLQNYMPW